MEKSDLELPKVKKESSNNTLAVVFGGLSVVFIGYIAYLYMSFDMVKKGEKKDTPSIVQKEAPATFESLPYDIKNKYIEVVDHENKINSLEKDLNSKMETIKTELNTCNTEKEKADKIISKIDEKIAEVAKMQENIAEIENLVQEKDTSSINKSNFVTFGCYDMLESGYHPSKKCISDLKLFLDKNKDDTKLFEVIGVVNNQDFTLLKKLKDVYKKTNINRLEEFAQYGLSRKRVIEATWTIKEHLGSLDKVSSVNYTAVSKKGHKGFVVRAYK